MYENIRLFLFDVDGVLTDGTFVLDSSGQETRSWHARDGAAIKWMIRSGVTCGFLTGRSSRVVELRAAELGVTVVRQGSKRKLETLDGILAAEGVGAADVAYMGDDLVDLPVMRAVGLSFAPADARPEVLDIATHVTRAGGGSGAAREAIEILMKARGDWEAVVARYMA